jgi:hypothetical protein
MAVVKSSVKYISNGEYVLNGKTSSKLIVVRTNAQLLDDTKMKHNKLTGSSTRSNNILCFNSAVRSCFFTSTGIWFSIKCQGQTM